MFEYVNIPDTLPKNVYHRTFFSDQYGHEIGYHIYLPAGYENSGKCYPVHYHLHGWMGDESTEIGIMENVYRDTQTIFVFPNNSPTLGNDENLPVEQMLLEELIPHIDQTYRTIPERAGRTISGFSMGGGMALYFAVKYPEMFAEVTAYAGTFHHYYHKDFMTPGEPVDRAEELYRGMLTRGWESDRSILWLTTENRERLQNRMKINLCVGTEDPLYCDSEVMHMHLNSLGLTHAYRIILGVSHVLADIL